FTPNQPRSAIFRTFSHGKRLSASSSRATGAISDSAKSRTSWRRLSCWSVKYGLISLRVRGNELKKLRDGAGQGKGPASYRGAAERRRSGPGQGQSGIDALQHLQKPGTVAIEPGRTDAGDRGECSGIPRGASGDFPERTIVEDHVRRDLVRARNLGSKTPECLETPRGLCREGLLGVRGRCARPILSSAPQCVPGCARNARSTAANAAHRAGCPALPRRWHIGPPGQIGRQGVVAAIAGVHRLRVTEVAQDVAAATLLRVRVPLHALQPALLALPSLRECMPVDREGPVRLLQELP